MSAKNYLILTNMRLTNVFHLKNNLINFHCQLACFYEKKLNQNSNLSFALLMEFGNPNDLNKYGFCIMSKQIHCEMLTKFHLVKNGRKMHTSEQKKQMDILVVLLVSAGHKLVQPIDTPKKNTHTHSLKRTFGFSVYKS